MSGSTVYIVDVEFLFEFELQIASWVEIDVDKGIGGVGGADWGAESST